MPRLFTRLVKAVRADLDAWGIKLAELKATHYARNDAQRDDISYAEVMLSDFKLMADEKSVFHRLNKSWDNGNGHNSKWVSSDGHQEYVFRYYGDAATGSFRMVPASSPLNIGTYNLKPSGVGARSDLEHLAADIIPWILWGNSPEDAQAWKWKARARIVFEDGLLKANFDKAATRWALAEFDFADGADRNGNAGANRMHGQAIAENFDGRGGKDTVSYENANRAVTVNLNKGEGYDGWAKGDSFVSIENLTGSTWGDILIGDARGNHLRGMGGSDRLIGGDGNNTLDGGKHDDSIYGGSGNDTIEGGKHDDLIFGDYVRVGQPHGDDRIDGGGGNDWVQGGGGNDTVSGGKGMDTLLGGHGDDQIDGGAQRDQIFGEAGNDTIVLKHAAADTVDAGAGDDMIVVEVGYDHVIDGGDGRDIVDLRGLDLARLDSANFAGVEEFWVDDAFLAPVEFFFGGLVRVFGNPVVRTSASEFSGNAYLFGGAEIIFEHGATVTVTIENSLKLPLLHRKTAQYFAYRENPDYTPDPHFRYTVIDTTGGRLSGSFAHADRFDASGFVGRQSVSLFHDTTDLDFEFRYSESNRDVTRSFALYADEVSWKLDADGQVRDQYTWNIDPLDENLDVSIVFGDTLL